MFEKILIANRGEIACRVMRTARRMGIATVAVYSSADEDAVHVRAADEAVGIGEPPAAASYLAIDRIVEACLETGAQAVHPGYGFLSENPRFARELEKAGVVFIGPRTRALEVMGDKIASKQLASEAGVNTIPGHARVIEGPEHAVEIARAIGYPVMIKASAGGGGKGMRVARTDAECREGYERATSEARSSFGDERLLVEKLIEEPRHIEVQVLADEHGHILHLPERECSLQRRHQKVVEEAPSPFLDAATRKRMGEQAVALARAVDYCSAGTVEFVVDRDRNFYFLEMNTRLQVEHPVTEAITGLDLVEEMIRVAAGEKLRWRQEQIGIDGWAIEARVYAEDPARGFLPSTGRLVRYLPPQEREGVRVDAGVGEGGEVSIFYDPMIAKLVVHGADRRHAIGRMLDALDRFYIRGLAHNIGFLSDVIGGAHFATGALSTDLIGRDYPDGYDPGSRELEEPALFAAIAAWVHERCEPGGGARQRAAGTQHGSHTMTVVMRGDNLRVHTEPIDGGYAVSCGDSVYRMVSSWCPNEPLFRASVNGVWICAQVERDGLRYRLFHRGCQVEAMVVRPRTAELLALMPQRAATDQSSFLRSPMPGLLTRLLVAPGDEVVADQCVAIIEAMKMENALCVERPGKIAEIMVAAGDSVAVDQPILQFDVAS